jgi:hypothetical protein
MHTLALVMGWIIAILLGCFALVIIYDMLIGKIELQYLICGSDGDASLSRFQFLIFTFVIAMGLFMIMVSMDRPEFPAVPGSILALLGISGGSYVTSKGVDASAPPTILTTTTTPNPPPLPPTTTTEISQPGPVA